MVTKATSSTFTVSKPFFTLSFYDGKQTYEDTFSMYDIENAPTTVSADEITIDGSASSIAEFSNYLGTKSVDGSLKVTWSLGNHSYSKTVKNVYSTSYVIPVSWLDAISDSSQAYGGGKVTVQISYGTKVYTTISATFNCIVSDTFLPTISSVTLADKTNTPVPASWNKVFVQNQSGIRVSAITCAASQGATVKRIKLRLDTQYTEQTYSASSLPQINRIINSGSLECEVTITDSRGRTCSKTATVNVLPYDIPKFTLIESDRCNKTGEMDNDGTYFLSQSAVEYSSCTGLNSITITAEYKKTDTSEWLNKKTIKPGSNVLGGELDIEFSYDVRYVLKYDIKTYASPTSTTVIETVKPTEGTGGTELTTLNSGQRMCYGSNNYKESAVREWLNSDKVAGSVWTPATNYDRPPSWVSNKAGFMNGMDADFLAVIGKTTKVTCRNNVTDGGGSDTTKDKFFLLSRRELFMGDEVSSVKEGEPYPYYSNYSDYTSPNTGADSNRVKYKNGSPQWQWERTPNAGNSSRVRIVGYAGGLSYSGASGSGGVAPACNVI